LKDHGGGRCAKGNRSKRRRKCVEIVMQKGEPGRIGKRLGGRNRGGKVQIAKGKKKGRAALKRGRGGEEWGEKKGREEKKGR